VNNAESGMRGNSGRAGGKRYAGGEGKCARKMKGNDAIGNKREAPKQFRESDHHQGPPATAKKKSDDYRCRPYYEEGAVIPVSGENGAPGGKEQVRVSRQLK